jgi:hypothetical protein
MIKTPHRLLHDSLSKEDYARVLVNMRKNEWTEAGPANFYSSLSAKEALRFAFLWSNSNEDGRYWVIASEGWMP